jgi:serine protease Do
MQKLNNQTKPSFLFLFSSILMLFYGLSPLLAAEKSGDSITALRQMGRAFAQIAEKASPAVVGIRANKVSTQQYQTTPDWPFGDPFGGDDFFNRFFERQQPQQRSQPRQRRIVQPVQGSGFIVSEDGYILTNNHLVGESEAIWVKIGDSAEIKAQMIGTDPCTDVAVIKVNKKNLSFLELADSDKIEVGEWVLAIGNPFGLSHTVTAGIISAKGRSAGINRYEDFIQTDAAINPGNSGGPLLNLDGKVIGINAAIIGPSGNIGIGFAVPINMANKVYKDLITEGRIIRGYLGVSIQDLTDEMADSLGSKGTKGALVPQVIKDSPADKAGIKQNDIIVEFDGKAINGSKELQSIVQATKPGKDVKVIVMREGQKKTLTANLEEQKRTESAAVKPKETADTFSTLGISAQNLTSQLAQQLGFEGTSGVVITNIASDSAAERSGLAAGMLILEVNKKKINSVDDFRAEINKVSKGENVLMLVQVNSGNRQFVVLKVPED